MCDVLRYDRVWVRFQDVVGRGCPYLGVTTSCLTRPSRVRKRERLTFR